MEKETERIGRAAARRRKGVPAGGEWKGLPEERKNRNFFYIAAGSVLVALVAFLCGIQMGKSLGELKGGEETAPKFSDRKGESPPFRLMEKGREAKLRPEAKPVKTDSGEESKEKEPASAPPQPNSRETSAPEKKAPPEEEKTSAAKGKYAIQIAAFNNAGEAQEMISQLKKKGYEAYQVTGSGAAKGMLHRVRIGHFHSLQEARQFAMAFEKKENIKPIISGTP